MCPYICNYRSNHGVCPYTACINPAYNGQYTASNETISINDKRFSALDVSNVIDKVVQQVKAELEVI